MFGHVINPVDDVITIQDTARFHSIIKKQNSNSVQAQRSKFSASFTLASDDGRESAAG